MRSRIVPVYIVETAKEDIGIKDNRALQALATLIRTNEPIVSEKVALTDTGVQSHGQVAINPAHVIAIRPVAGR